MRPEKPDGTCASRRCQYCRPNRRKREKSLRRDRKDEKIHSQMVGAEGFEASFPSGHFALFSVEVKGKPSQNRKLPKFSGMPFFPLFSYHWTAFRKKLVSLVSPSFERKQLKATRHCSPTCEIVSRVKLRDWPAIGVKVAEIVSVADSFNTASARNTARFGPALAIQDVLPSGVLSD